MPSFEILAMPAEAFIPLLPIPRNLLHPQKPATPPSTPVWRLPRRAFLLYLAIPVPALADRTGKYSTKLTAKRRYLPRIQAGIETIRTAVNESSADGLTQDRMDDLFAAMVLFATTYFSEGNRVSAKEKLLMSFVGDAKRALDQVRKGSGFASLITPVDAFVQEAGLGELAGIHGIGSL